MISEIETWINNITQNYKWCVAEDHAQINATTEFLAFRNKKKNIKLVVHRLQHELTQNYFRTSTYMSQKVWNVV
jgi:hypothetical protein